MVSNPKPNQRVRLWYAEKYCREWVHHGKFGTVVIRGRGKPRNHLVRLDDGSRVMVPAGNLLAVK